MYQGTTRFTHNTRTLFFNNMAAAATVAPTPAAADCDTVSLGDLDYSDFDSFSEEETVKIVAHIATHLDRFFFRKRIKI